MDHNGPDPGILDHLRYPRSLGSISLAAAGSDHLDFGRSVAEVKGGITGIAATLTLTCTNAEAAANNLALRDVFRCVLVSVERRGADDAIQDLSLLDLMHHIRSEGGELYVTDSNGDVLDFNTNVTCAASTTTALTVYLLIPFTRRTAKIPGEFAIQPNDAGSRVTFRLTSSTVAPLMDADLTFTALSGEVFANIDNTLQLVKGVPWSMRSEVRTEQTYTMAPRAYRDVVLISPNEADSDEIGIESGGFSVSAEPRHAWNAARRGDAQPALDNETERAYGQAENEGFVVPIFTAPKGAGVGESPVMPFRYTLDAAPGDNIRIVWTQIGAHSSGDAEGTVPVSSSTADHQRAAWNGADPAKKARLVTRAGRIATVGNPVFNRSLTSGARC